MELDFCSKVLGIKLFLDSTVDLRSSESGPGRFEELSQAARDASSIGASKSLKGFFIGDLLIVLVTSCFNFDP